MNCERSRELFVDYIGEELSRSDVRDLKKHLELCQTCREELATLADTRNLLQRGWPDESMPQGLTLDLGHSRSSDRTYQFGGFRVPRFVMVSLTATACVVLCVAVLALVQTQILFENGKLAVSFGQAEISEPLRPQTPSAAPINTSELVDRREVQALIEEALKKHEQVQKAGFGQALLSAKSDWEVTLNAALRRIDGELKYLEKVQRVVWKEAAMNNSHLNTLARDLYVRTSSQGPLQ